MITNEEIEEMLNLWDQEVDFYSRKQKEKVKLEKKKKCECGSDKCKLPHSRWCPKYEA